MDNQTVTTNLEEKLPRKTGPRDVFLHLLAMVTLYASAASFITLLYQMINVLIPDPLMTSYVSSDFSYSAIRWSIASLIVVFPVFIFTTRYLNKLYEVRVEIRGLRTRRWLVYLTLFAAALMIIIDLVTLVYRLLGGGELTLRFILKVLTVFFTGASIFYYYYYELKRTKSE